VTVAFVTGAGGFIGRHLVDRLTREGWQFIAAVRGTAGNHANALTLGDLAAVEETKLAATMAHVDVVYHLAGRAHRVDGGRAADQKAHYDRDNVAATQQVYSAARLAGVPRLIYLSTIKVLGEVSAEPLSVDAPPAPPDVYSASKLAAERWLLEQVQGPAVSIVRPPLVVGAGVKGNLAALIGWVRRGWPLPLGAARAPRSMIGVDNLIDLLIKAIDDQARTRILHLRDDDEPTAAELVGVIADALNKPARLWNTPPELVRLAARAARRLAAYSALFEPFRVDDSATRRDFNWQPRRSIEATMVDAVRGWP
jgi:nucleoside-diphosphate-sugar epimerase